MSSAARAARIAVLAIAGGTILQSICAVLLGRISIETTLVYIIIAVYCGIQADRYVQRKSMLTAYGATMDYDDEDDESRTARHFYAVVHLGVLVAGLIISFRKAWEI